MVGIPNLDIIFLFIRHSETIFQAHIFATLPIFLKLIETILTCMAANSIDFEALFVANFSCEICSQVLFDPVQCENNEHYFCRRCITKRLRTSQTCPQCFDQLTEETLRGPSRIVANVVAQLKKPRCSHVSRGCTKNVLVEELLLHEETCGYAPVVCSNEGCKKTVSKRDKESHQTEECKFRKITCKSCNKVMTYSLYEMHLCAVRLELDKMKSRLERVTRVLKQIDDTQADLQEKLEACEQRVEVSKESVPVTFSTTFLQESRATTTTNSQIFVFGESNNLQDKLKACEQCVEVSKESVPDTISATLSQESHATTTTNSQIYIIGESNNAWRGKSLEVFDWSTMTWSLYEDCLIARRCSPVVYLEGEKIMVYGGQDSKKMECLIPSETGITSTLVPTSTDGSGYYDDYNGIKYGNRIITFYRNVVETSTEPPYNSRTLLFESFTRLVCSVVRIGKSIYVVGGQPSTMEHYDLAKNQLTRLSPVPYPVTRAACVAYEDNVIIIGGEDDRRPLNTVTMFNTTTQEYSRLPSMLQNRAGCAAVIMGDMIVVMGGGRRNKKNFMNFELSSVEYHVIGEDAWHELPEMNKGRAYATALVYE